MGYFKRKIDRGRARRIARAHDHVDVPLEPAWTRVLARPPRKRCFLRFSSIERNLDSGRREGVFTASYALLGGRVPLDEGARCELRTTLDWFCEHLPSPEDFDRPRAIFLFKSDAGECMRRIWNLVRILGSHGSAIEMQRVDQPGRIVYEDEFQVAVLPWGCAGDL